MNVSDNSECILTALKDDDFLFADIYYLPQIAVYDTWDDAKSYCESQGMHLAEFDTLDEWDNLNNMISTNALGSVLFMGDVYSGQVFSVFYNFYR